jgi:hypothetical protein
MFPRLAAAALAAGLLLAPAPAHAEATCESRAFPVNVAGLQQTMAGTLCGTASSYRAAEAPYYGPAARLEAYVLPGYGHALNYAPNLHAAVVAWADRMVGR